MDETKTTLRAEFSKDWAGLPNLITEARLVLSPVAAILYLVNPDKLYWIAMLVFIFVASTDKIDGYHLCKGAFGLPDVEEGPEAR